jgi:hypothetical protein
MLEFKKIQGVGDVEPITIRTPTSNGGFADLTDKYTGDEELLCVLWPGDDQAVTATLPATWDSGPLGQVRITFPQATMATLEATWYYGLLTLADSSEALAEFRVEVEAGPGAAAALKVYHSYKDLLDEAPWAAKLADQLKDQSGFAEVRAESRRWVDAAILRAVPTLDWGPTSYRTYAASFYGSLPYDPYGSLGLADDPTIAAALDADQLILTTSTGRRFVQAAVYKTLSVITRRAVGMTANNDLLALSEKYEVMADKKLATCVAEIDVNADGIPEHVFSLASRARLRRA